MGLTISAQTVEFVGRVLTDLKNRTQLQQVTEHRQYLVMVPRTPQREAVWAELREAVKEAAGGVLCGTTKQEWSIALPGATIRVMAGTCTTLDGLRLNGVWTQPGEYPDKVHLAIRTGRLACNGWWM
ncbi:MAG TPA: hypothetical protein VGK74_02650 [Symbiobacteriaceae bacterium]|jgi:hypothetical protein